LKDQAARIIGFTESGELIFTDSPETDVDVFDFAGMLIKKGHKPAVFKPELTTKDILVEKLVKTRKSRIPDGITIPSDVKTRIDLSEWLIAQGFNRQTQEYFEVYKLLRDEFSPALEVGDDLNAIMGNTDPGTPALPPNVTTKIQLSDWLVRGLKVKRGSEHFDRLYKLYRETLEDGY